MFASGQDPEAIVEAKGLKQITDPDELRGIIEGIMASNEDKVAQYRDGKTKLLGFFVGQTMRATQGKASPGVVNELLKEMLGAS